MISIEIPNTRAIQAEYLVLDYNGTLAIDGQLIAGVEEKLNELSSRINIHVVTADTYGKAAESLKDVHCTCIVIGKQDQQQQKLEYIKGLGPEKVIAIGNGLNDALMLQEAALGFSVLQKEGACAKSLLHADIIFSSVMDALDALEQPLRIVATMRG